MAVARQTGRCGRWVDDDACSAICLLILQDKRGKLPAGDDRWSSRPALPAILYSQHIGPFLRLEAPLPNMLYAIGGRNRSSGPVDKVEMLDTWTGCWVVCPPMPRRRAGGAAAPLPDGRLLIVGGYDERGIAQGLLSSCDIYNPYREEWEEAGAAPLQRGRWGHGCAALDGKVFAVGGCSVQQETRAEQTFMETLRSCEVYDPLRNQWKPSAPLQVARSGSRVVALGSTRLAAVGGCDDVFGRAETQATVEIYDSISGCWELLSTRLARPRTSAAVAALDDRRFFIAGGAPSQLSVEVYCAPAWNKVERTASDISTRASDDGFSDEEDILVKAPKTPTSKIVQDMMEGRMGCQAAVVRLPRKGRQYPMCESDCVLVVGGERSEDTNGTSGNVVMPRVRQLETVAAYDIEEGEWRENGSVPPLEMPRTTIALCIGVGRPAACRLPTSTAAEATSALKQALDF